MIKSMTGFGKAEKICSGIKITVEIKSLNSKQLDLFTRVPAAYRQKENILRSMVAEGLGRGKVDLAVTREAATGDVAGSAISEELFTSYYNRIQEICRKVGATEDIVASVLRMPGVVDSSDSEISDDEWEALTKAVAEAVSSLNSFRETEGKRLISDILCHIDKIQALSLEIPQYEAERIDAVKERLRSGLQQLGTEVDKNRFEQEIIYYLEKLDITEEKVRLAQHIGYFRETAASGEDVGRKLGFIAQEMGREINTTGSKANHTEIQKLVVQMKDELEKIKEQLCNIL